MNVSEIMTLKPVTIAPDATLGQALEIMERVGCRHLPVISNDEHLVGIVSDRDCRLALNSSESLRKQWQDKEVSKNTSIAMIMTPAPIVVEPDVPAHEAAKLLMANRISSLPVMRGETLIGIVTTSDVLVAFMCMAKRRETMT